MQASRCFPENFGRFFRTILYGICGQLHLNISFHMKRKIKTRESLKRYCYPQTKLLRNSSIKTCNIIHFRSSCLQVFYEISVFKNFAKLTGKHLCWSLFWIKKIFQHSCFPVNFAKCLRRPILYIFSERLPLTFKTLKRNKAILLNCNSSFGNLFVH